MAPAHGQRPYESADAGAPECDPGAVTAGANSSNRPWETATFRIGLGGALPLGYLAIAAAAAVAVADISLLFSPAVGGPSPEVGSLPPLPGWRLTLGHYLGALCLPFWIAGYWLVFQGLEPAGEWLSWPVFLLAVYASAVGIALRATVAPLALGSFGSPELVARGRPLVAPLEAVVVVLLLVASLWFAVAVGSGRSRLPRWLAVANPFALGLLFVALLLLLPGARPAMAVPPAAFSLGHLVFFGLVTASLARRREAD